MTFLLGSPGWYFRLGTWSSDTEPSRLLLEEEELLAADRFSREGGSLVTEEASASLLDAIGMLASFIAGLRSVSSARNTESRLTSTEGTKQ